MRNDPKTLFMTLYKTHTSEITRRGPLLALLSCTLLSHSSFNQDIGGWAVHSVENMLGIFNKASAFDQNLGWCVADGVSLEYAFYNTTCAPTRCGVTQGSCP